MCTANKYIVHPVRLIWNKIATRQPPSIQWYCAMTLRKDGDMWFLRSTVRMQDCHFCDKGSIPLGTATYSMLIRFNIFNNTLCKECSKRLEKDYKYEPWRKHYIVDSDDWLAQEINNNKNR